ncbi:Cacna1d [Symbiodinium pilosum]|uniref:Cacna1d protein n=1 Tax=Symbiodinium pilosum TaxID=2952 RepID=A0A812U299_SYMPI|nr:Cacna1d [Symbiodinium pilosum]
MSHRAFESLPGEDSYAYSLADQSPTAGSAEAAEERRQEHERLEEIEKKLAEKKRRLQELDEFYDHRREAIRRRVADKQDQVDHYRRKSSMYRSSPKFRMSNGPPGCRFFQFVDEAWFDGVVALVIVLNLLLIVMELTDDTKGSAFFWWDTVILVFYIAEFCSRLALHHEDLLFGPCTAVWTFWVDLLIIVVGVLDLWICPQIFRATPPAWTAWLQGLRAVRVVKLVRLLNDTSWADEQGFQLFILAVILSNALMIGLELNFPDFQGFRLLDNLMLAIFTFEIIVRIRNSGCRFFHAQNEAFYNWLDLVIVMLGVVEQWLLPLVGFSLYMSGAVEESPFGEGQPQTQAMRLLRLARLLRLMRLLRLIRNIPPLYTLAIGILESFQGMTWVFLLALVVLYTCAILCTQLIGHRLIVPVDFPESASRVFPSVGDSMFVLFKVMNADTGPLEPLFSALPISKLFTACFMILSNWAILAILTAVVSENLISACADHRKQHDDAAQQEKRQNLSKIFFNIFVKMDEQGDANRKVSRPEFERMRGELEAELEAANIYIDNLSEWFELLCKKPSIQEDPQVDLDDLLDALHLQSKEVSQRTLMRMERRIGSLEAMVCILLGEDPKSPRKQSEKTFRSQNKGC